MKPNQLLIDALRKTAADVLTPMYDWSFCARCNCGLLARNLMGATQEQFAGINQTRARQAPTMDQVPADIEKMVGPWGREDFGFCPLTNLPQTDITKILFKYGIEKGDYQRLESLAGTPEIAQDAGCFSDPKTVSKVFLRWADELEAQLKVIQSHLQPTPKETCADSAVRTAESTQEQPA